MKKKRFLLWITLFVVVVLTTTTFLMLCCCDYYINFYVVLTGQEGDTTVYDVSVPIDDTATLTIVYRHSVIRLDVRDIIKVDREGFHALWSELPDFGAGLPAESSVEVATITDMSTNYKVEVTGKRDFKRLSYLMIPFNRYRFYVNGNLVLMPDVNGTGIVVITLERGCLLWHKGN